MSLYVIIFFTGPVHTVELVPAWADLSAALPVQRPEQEAALGAYSTAEETKGRGIQLIFINSYKTFLINK